VAKRREILKKIRLGGVLTPMEHHQAKMFFRFNHSLYKRERDIYFGTERSQKRKRSRHKREPRSLPELEQEG
jgi:hypothetical protein